mgnify:CR=1 FL=1
MALKFRRLLLVRLSSTSLVSAGRWHSQLFLHPPQARVYQLSSSLSASSVSSQCLLVRLLPFLVVLSASRHLSLLSPSLPSEPPCPIHLPVSPQLENLNMPTLLSETLPAQTASTFSLDSDFPGSFLPSTREPGAPPSWFLPVISLFQWHFTLEPHLPASSFSSPGES